MDHGGFADAVPRVLDRQELLRELQRVADADLVGRPAHEGDGALGQRAAERTEHRSIMHGLRRWDGGVGVTHGRCSDSAAFEHEIWPDTEKGR